MKPAAPFAHLSVLVCLSLQTVHAAPPADALPWGRDPPSAPAYARVAALTELGRQIFRDPGLSSSGKLSCASCHDPANHYAAGNFRVVQLGGIRLDLPGTRAVPSLTYTSTIPFFTEHYRESADEGDESLDQGPTGGRTWDGRVNRARDQAAIPLLSLNEMGNPGELAVVQHAARAPYASQITKLFGPDIFKNTHAAFLSIGEALETYQESPAEFAAFTSKYDAFLRGQAQLTPQELRGMAAFNDPARGNCNQCHRSQVPVSRALPLFTDFGLIALGLPRNPKIPANADPAYYDLGACGPLRHDLKGRAEFCGLFKAPSLRNVATRHTFYHNGIFQSLEEAVSFYATRDSDPGRWYPRGPDGQVQKFNDLPPQYRGNVNMEPPFGRKPGDPPAFSPQDVSDIVAFLNTLTDGYAPAGGKTAATDTQKSH